MATYASRGDRFIDRTISLSAIKPSVSTDTGRGLSPAIWGNCPILEYKNNQNTGSFMYDDFTDNGIVIAANTLTAAASALGTTGNWTGCTAATAGTAITTLATNYQGVVHLESTTDNEDCIIAYPKTAHSAGVFNFTSGKKLWAEARVSLLNITDSKFNAFFGFAEEGLVATTTLITASDAMADKDFIGFQRVFADGDKLDVVFNTAGGGGATTALADAVTIVADTFIKIGMYCDGTNVYFFSNGSVVAATTALTATNFPNGEEMAFYVGLMLGHADTASLNVDWVAIAQER